MLGKTHESTDSGPGEAETGKRVRLGAGAMGASDDRPTGWGTGTEIQRAGRGRSAWPRRRRIEERVGWERRQKA